MSSPIKVLILEDVPADAELAEHELSRALGPCLFLRVDNRQDFIAALTDLRPDMIVSDYTLPTFDGLAALRIAQEFCSEVPFVILTGSLNEDTAVACMKAGAWDYVIKEHAKRLGEAARRAIDLRQLKAEREEAEASLRRSEQRLRVAQEIGRVGHWELDVKTHRLEWSEAVFAIVGRTLQLGPPSPDEEERLFTPSGAKELRELIQKSIATGESFELPLQVHRTDGTTVDIITYGSAMTDESGTVARLLGTVQDVSRSKRAEARIRHLNSVVEAIRSVNKLMIRERDPKRLIQQACKLLVAHRGFRGAWILQRNATGHVEYWAQAGFDADTDEMNHSFGKGFELPCWEKVHARTESVVVLDAETSCGDCPLIQPGCHAHSVIAKLTHGGASLGLLGVSYPLNWPTDDEENALLGEFAADLAFALHDIEVERQRNRFAQIVASSREAMALVSPGLVYLEANQAYARLMGVSLSQLVGQPVSASLRPRDFESTVKPRLVRSLSGEEVEFESELAQAGANRYLSAIYSPCYRADQTIAAVAVCIRDITDRRVAETALRESENRYRMLAENAGLGIGYYGLDGTLIFFNSKAAQIMGGSPGAFEGKSLTELYGEELGSLILGRIQLAATEGTKIYEDVIRLHTEPTWYLSTYAVIRDAFGRVLGVQIISNDITDRKRAELALQMERDNLSAFLAAAPAAILVLNHAGTLVHCNAEAESLLGKPLSQAFGKRSGDLLECAHHREGPRGCGTGFNCVDCPLFSIVRGTLRDRTSAHGKEVVIELSGRGTERRRWFVANSAPLTLEDGSGVILALHDVTERKTAEEKLRFQALLLESQNEASIDGILINDPRGKVIWHNRRFTELLGIPTNAVVDGVDVASMSPLLERLDSANDYQARLTALFADCTSKTHDELRLSDGRTLEHIGAPILGESKEFLGRVWLFRDVTNEKQLRASVAQSDRLASMGMLAAGVAHEINNPLSYVLYNLESLQEDLGHQLTQSARVRTALAAHLPPELLDSTLETCPNLFDFETLSDMEVRFRDALSGTRRIKSIARGLGTFSRVEKHQAGPISITGPVESALSIAFNEIKYRARIEKELLATALVRASEGQISQVFLNLLINAAHAIADGDVEHNRISVRTWEREGEVYASVEDSGCGIPADLLERIFDPFFTTKPVGVGTGLGLNIVRDIITKCGGSIHVSSRVGKGTVFVIRLPMALSSKPSSMLPPPSAPEHLGPRGRILVVDDEAQVRTALCRILTRHQVVQTDSGEGACAILDTDQGFDLILCDVMMPRMSGIELHRWLTARYPALARRVAFVTGGVFTAASSAYLAQHENLTIEKPIDAATLRRQVSDFIAATQDETKRPLT